MTIKSFIAITLSHLAALFAVPAHAAEGVFEDFPILVQCEYAGIVHVYYLLTIDPTGAAVYMAPDRQAGWITLTGKAAPVGNDTPGSCSGKTLEQLRASGQAYDLKR